MSLNKFQEFQELAPEADLIDGLKMILQAEPHRRTTAEPHTRRNT